jgi:thiamine-phosphate pyrophosphorylase
MPYPDRFYPVVDTLAWVERLCALGVGTLQLRVKDLTHKQVMILIRPAIAAAGAVGAKLVINDYWRAAIEAGAAHLHLGHEDLATADIAAIRKAGLTFGLSTHDEAELDEALRHDPDYVAFGPIYPTTVKPMTVPPQGLERIAQWKKNIGKIPLVAIGGITLERAPAVYAAGADSIAVVTDITRNTDPDARVKSWLAQAG